MHAELREPIFENQGSFPYAFYLKRSRWPQLFFAFLTQVTIKEIYRVENFGANVLKALEMIVNAVVLTIARGHEKLSQIDWANIIQLSSDQSYSFREDSHIRLDVTNNHTKVPKIYLSQCLFRSVLLH